MNIILDNIIFSLQQAGGISVVWYELLKRILKDDELKPLFIDEVSQNIFRQNLIILESTILNNSLSKYPLTIGRYFNPKLPKNKGIFHSSYYRISKNPFLANITTVHDFTYEYFRNGIGKYIHQFQKGNAIINSQRIICVSNNTKADLFKFYPKVGEDRIKVIYNGVNDNYYPLLIEDEISLSHLIPFSKGEFALYIGDRKSLYKNFFMAVKACKISGLPLVMVGGGAITKNEILLLNETLGKQKFKHLNGINNEQLNLIYNHALCLLYPSLYEGFGIPILEAQRAGCPVISTNYSSIPEVAGKGAILLNEVTENTIAEILKLLKNDLRIIDELKEEGFKNSKRFSWDKCYQQTKELYKEVYEEYF